MSLLSLGPPVNWLQDRMKERFDHVGSVAKGWRLGIFEPRVREALRNTQGFYANVSVSPDSRSLKSIIEARLISLCRYGEPKL